MLCCLGLVSGFAVGAALGGPLAFVAPVVGFSLGLIGDLTLIKHGLHSFHKNAKQQFHVQELEVNDAGAREV